MKVVSDTSPICYLVLIGQADLLEALFGNILIPPAVREELSHPRADVALQSWIANPPDWLQERPSPQPVEASLDRLDPGEREAILLAEHLQADLLILDERQAREAARARGLPVTGLLGILDQAAERNLIDLPEAVSRLRETTFRAEPRLLKLLLERRLGLPSERER